MKKILIQLFFLISTTGILLSHDQEIKPVHQRIVVEAYKLLKLQFSKEENGFADMDQYIGNTDIQDIYYWYDVTTVAGSSEHEDRKDIVYGYGWWFTTITHFWDADHPEGKMKLFSGGWFPSAYTKACKYFWDDYTKIFKFPHDGGETAGYQKLWCAREPDSYLYKWYWKDKIWVNHAHDVAWYTLWIPFDKMNNYYYECGSQFCRELFFNILGRVCHLLTDMGVPEHARRSNHIAKNTSPFEHWLSDEYDNEFYWTAEKVYKERGGFINPFCEVNNDNNLFLFYTMAQLSDWFCTYGGFAQYGNNNYDPNIGEINSIITSYAPVDEEKYWRTDLPVGAPSALSYSFWDLDNEEGRKFRDVLFPYTIRAVAGMLYKYIIETKMQFPNATEFDMGLIYDQQQELNLFNQDIDGNHYTFRAEGNPGRIVVCPESRPEGYPADFKIGSNARNVTFRAANEIIFKDGFVAKKGSDVHAYLFSNCSRTNQSGNCKECLDEDFNPQYDKSN